MGRPLPGIETRVVDGELQLRVDTSPTFFSRYVYGESFEGEWWSTGDLVEEDEDGFLYHRGRNDDLITSSGYRIGPVEVESVLLEHPAVAEVAVVAAPDPEGGEPGAEPGDLVGELGVGDGPGVAGLALPDDRRPVRGRGVLGPAVDAVERSVQTTFWEPNDVTVHEVAAADSVEGAIPVQCFPSHLTGTSI